MGNSALSLLSAPRLITDSRRIRNMNKFNVVYWWNLVLDNSPKLYENMVTKNEQVNFLLLIENINIKWLLFYRRVWSLLCGKWRPLFIQKIWKHFNPEQNTAEALLIYLIYTKDVSFGICARKWGICSVFKAHPFPDIHSYRLVSFHQAGGNANACSPCQSPLWK